MFNITFFLIFYKNILQFQGENIWVIINIIHFFPKLQTIERYSCVICSDAALYLLFLRPWKPPPAQSVSSHPLHFSVTKFIVYVNLFIKTSSLFIVNIQVFFSLHVQIHISCCENLDIRWHHLFSPYWVDVILVMTRTTIWKQLKYIVSQSF